MFQAKVDTAAQCMIEARELIAHFAGNCEYPASAVITPKLIDEQANERYHRLNSTALLYRCSIQQYGSVSNT